MLDNVISMGQEGGVVKSIPANGRSMYPLIKSGDSISIKFCNREDIKVGDIVAFRRGEITVVHRLIKKTGTGFLEKGDLQIRAQFIKPEMIMGKVVMNSMKGRANKWINRLLTFSGYIIHRLGAVKFLAKPLLLIPLVINAGTRAITKMR